MNNCHILKVFSIIIIGWIFEFSLLDRTRKYIPTELFVYIDTYILKYDFQAPRKRTMIIINNLHGFLKINTRLASYFTFDIVLVLEFISVCVCYDFVNRLYGYNTFTFNNQKWVF